MSAVSANGPLGVRTRPLLARSENRLQNGGFLALSTGLSGDIDVDRQR